MKKIIFCLSLSLLLNSCGKSKIDKIIDKANVDIDAYIKTGNEKMDMQDYKGAIDDYSQAIKIDPNDTIPYMLRFDAKVKLEDYYGAKEDLTKVIEIDPNNVFAYYNRGLIEIVLNQDEKACIDFSKAGDLGEEKAYDKIKLYCN